MPDKKRINLRLLLVGTLALAGIGFLIYPWVSNQVYDLGVNSQKKNYINRVHTVQAGTHDALDDLYYYLQSENERIYNTGQASLVDAFSYQQSNVDLAQYGIENNCIGFIEIPSINCEMPIYLGANTENLKLGAVHLTQTSYPIGGENTNAVIAAHRSITVNMLKDIDSISVGDLVIVTNFREQLHYRVVGCEVIQPNQTNKIMIQPGKDMITIFSCHPYGSTAQRYVVYCERIDADTTYPLPEK